MRHAAMLGLAAALMAAACRPRPEQTAAATRREVAWHQLGSWTGHGSTQTESFTSDTGALRVRWETSPVSGASRPAPGTPADPGTGTFRLTAHSAISGRLMQQIVDHAGPGHGVDYVQQDPHVFYVVVESADLNWRFTVEEAIEYP